MGHHFVELLREALVRYGYWVVAAGLLLENAGVPLPGETILLMASFLAYSRHELRPFWLIVTATLAASLGDNLGYAIGCYGGRALLLRYRHVFRLSDTTLARSERLFAQYGTVTILFARFVFGMRVVAGPLAGVLRMPWKRFTAFNIGGAAIWVTAITLVGYSFGSRWNLVAGFMRRFDLALLAIFATVLAVWAWWGRKSRSGT
ncbi:MAG TPA: DedA family protein [Candidatus Binatia bacterium]|nr:DedA family protein [Candidatus Binatia bacterium]